MRHASTALLRLDAIDWSRVTRELDADGVGLTGPLLDPDACRKLRALYQEDGRFRSRIVMQRHGFGAGEYRYFGEPLPGLVRALRTAVYERVAPLANDWNARMGSERVFPPSHAEFLERCHAGGQRRPTPLLLKYGPGDYNCLHQDVYGEHLFPIQLVILLSAPGEEFEGGELVLTEQRPRMQSRADVVPLGQGHGALFGVNDRPKQGTRGDYRVKMRHGVSRVRSGERFTMGVMFLDAA